MATINWSRERITDWRKDRRCYRERDDMKKSAAVVCLGLCVSQSAVEAACHRHDVAEEAKVMLAKVERRKHDDSHGEECVPRPWEVRTIIMNAATTKAEVYMFAPFDIHKGSR